MNIEFMKLAIEEAKKSDSDIPVGAVLVKAGEIIACTHNEKEKYQNPILHAEIVAINKVCEKMGTWRLNDCELYVTLEPCFMCAAAIIQARISKVYFGAYDNLYGALGSKADVREFYNSDLYVCGGILEEKCNNILKDFFGSLR